MGQLDGKVAVVTGSGRGIGQQTRLTKPLGEGESGTDSDFVSGQTLVVTGGA